MKTVKQNTEKNTISKFYLLLVLATTVGFAQEENQTVGVAQTQTTQVETVVKSEPVEQDGLKTRTKSNQTNERTTRPNGQDDGNPFPPKNLVKSGKPFRAKYDIKANKKV